VVRPETTFASVSITTRSGCAPLHDIGVNDDGGSWYRDNIPGGWPSVMEIDDWVTVEPGNMIGPTKQGVNALVAQDPGA